MADILDDLKAAPENLDWFFLSPAMTFGAYALGETLGHYRTGGDIPVTDDEGSSEISGADCAMAFVDEIEHPLHSQSRFTVAY